MPGVGLSVRIVFFFFFFGRRPVSSQRLARVVVQFKSDPGFFEYLLQYTHMHVGARYMYTTGGLSMAYDAPCG
eukprot:637972-Prymnesium_polylepis.1